MVRREYKKRKVTVSKVSSFLLLNPFNAQEDTGVPFHRNFNYIL